MRTNGVWLAMMVLLALSATRAQAQQPKAATILADYKPSFPGVEYDTPATAQEIEACKVEALPSGWEVKDAQGKLLRRFVDTNKQLTKRGTETKPSTHVDQWSYYKDGFEVYREVDLNEDGALDEVRWLNQGGTRIGEVKEGRLAGWKRISAEEATKVLTQAIIGGDLALLETVMATPDELKELGLPAAAIQSSVEARKTRRDSLAKLQKKLTGWDAQTNWSRFDGMMPHVMPGDESSHLRNDIQLYENGMVFVSSTRQQANPQSLAYLHVPDLIKVGDTWKFFNMPRAIDPHEPVAEADQGSLRSFVFEGGTRGGDGDEQVLIALSKALADFDAKMPGPDVSKNEIAKFHRDRIVVLNDQGIKKLTREENVVIVYKQVIHDLAEAYRTGLYPQGAGVFDGLIAMGGKIGSFAEYRRIMAEFDIEAEKDGAKPEFVLQQTLKKLENFLDRHPDGDEVAEVLLQLATTNDLDNEEDKAREFFGRLANQFPESDLGKKAAGALRRLDLNGKPLMLSGPTLAGKAARSVDYAGKTLLVVFWMSIAEPDRRELADLISIHGKYKDKNFDVLTVNLDQDKTTVEDYLRANSLPWPVIFEPGGLDSPLANQFGIVSTPTMFLVDSKGKVVSHRIRKASEVQRYLEKPLASGNAALDLDSNK